MKAKKIPVRRIAECALLIALEVVLNRFASFQVLGLKIGLSFLPMALCAMLFGPWWAAVCYGLSDLIGALLFPFGAYFPGFTLTAFLTGLVYGFFYRKGEVTLKTSIVPNLIVSFGLNLILDTIWLMILMGQGFWALLPTRIVKCVVMFVIQTALIPLVWNKIMLRTPITQ